MRALDGKGNLIELSVEEMKYSYRHSEAPEDRIFIDGSFKGTRGITEEIANRMKTIRAERKLTQPVKHQPVAVHSPTRRMQKRGSLLTKLGAEA